MIEVKARLLRGAVYMAGETIQCEVTFSNLNTTETNDCKKCNDTRENLKETSSRVETVAWASVQIHCQCSINESRVMFPNTRNRTLESTSSTSFVASRGEQGHCLLSTEPKILFCDLKLAPGEVQTFLYTDTIPAEAPPSYRGHAVKYLYKVTIGAGRLQASTKLLRLPLRVLSIKGLREMEQCINEREMPNSVFLEESVSKLSLLEIAMDYLSMATSRRNPHVYNITSGRGSVGRFCLFKSTYRIGEEVVGSFDFSDAAVPCCKYTVVLQCEEHIPKECRQPKKGGPAAITHSSHGSIQENCIHSKKTHVVLPIPMTVTPGFVSDMIELKWRLHFEFVIGKSAIPGAACPIQMTSPHSDMATWQGPQHVDTESMTWELPITILATSPLQASSISTIRTTNTIVF